MGGGAIAAVRARAPRLPRRGRPVEPGGAARQSGIEPGDIIVRYDGENVAGIDDLQRLLSAERIGKRTAATVLRRTQKIELPIEAAELPPR